VEVHFCPPDGARSFRSDLACTKGFRLGGPPRARGVRCGPRGLPKVPGKWPTHRGRGVARSGPSTVRAGWILV